MTQRFVLIEGKPTITKDPDDVLDYSWDWTDWLASIADTIASYTVTVDGITLDSHGIAGSVVTAWLSGGVIGQEASATCQVTTAGGRIHDVTLYFTIEAG